MFEGLQWRPRTLFELFYVKYVSQYYGIKFFHTFKGGPQNISLRLGGGHDFFPSQNISTCPPSALIVDNSLRMHGIYNILPILCFTANAVEETRKDNNMIMTKAVVKCKKGKFIFNFVVERLYCCHILYAIKCHYISLTFQIK